MNPNLFSVPQVAEYIGRSEDFVRRELKHQVAYMQHKPRGPLFFWKQDLDRWLAANTIQPVR